jgi:hypothetical protein
MEIFAFCDGHHHPQHIVMTENPVWEYHIHNRIQTFTYFRHDTFRTDLHKKQNDSTGPLDTLIVDTNNFFDIENITVVLGAFALELLTYIKKKAYPPVLIDLFWCHFNLDLDVS